MECPICGLDLDAIKRSRKLGCEHCAVVFKDDLMKISNRKNPSYFIETPRRRDPGLGE